MDISTAAEMRQPGSRRCRDQSQMNPIDEPNRGLRNQPLAPKIGFVLPSSQQTALGPPLGATGKIPGALGKTPPAWVRYCRGMRVPLLALVPALLWCQTSQQSTNYEVDINGNRVPGLTRGVATSATGSQRVETTRSINGRQVPLESTEDKVLSDDGRGNRVIERMVRRYDQNGNVGPLEKARIEERVNPDGSKMNVTTTYRDDLNGRPQIFERATTQTRESGGTTQTVIAVERGNPNGGLALYEKTTAVERKTSSGSQIESSTTRPDVNGQLSVAKSEVTTKSKSGAQENVDSTVYEPGIDGKLQMAGRRVATVTTKPDGSQVEEIDVYGRTVGFAADANAATPRLQQQILKEKVVRPDGSVVESTNVRSRVSHDSDRMSNYERTAETSTVATDAAGRQVRTTATTVNRRDASGTLRPAETAVTVAVEPKK